MGWEKDVIIKLLRLLEMIGLMLLLVVKIVIKVFSTVFTAALGPIILLIIIGLALVYFAGQINLPF